MHWEKIEGRQADVRHFSISARKSQVRARFANRGSPSSCSGYGLPATRHKTGINRHTDIATYLRMRLFDKQTDRHTRRKGTEKRVARWLQLNVELGKLLSSSLHIFGPQIGHFVILYMTLVVSSHRRMIWFNI